MKILWCGPFFSDLALHEKRAPNQAAAKWSRGLLKAINALGCEIRAVDHCPEQRWPKGSVVWQNADAKWFLDWFPCERVAYCNVIGIKDVWLAWSYARCIEKLCHDWRPDIILCYNSLHPFCVSAMATAARFGVKCVPIILDGDDPRVDNWRRLLLDNRHADGVVFLSWWMYKNYFDNRRPLFHMDGGADGFKGVPPQASLKERQNETKTIVHTGALDYWRGLRFMREVIRKCVRQDVRFVFCGKCDRKAMWREFDNDPRVEIKGFVSETEVEAICRTADVFLNVREPSVGDNLVNYPSKIPSYLCWGRPVVSTWIDSFSPDYRDVLEVCDNTPQGFVMVLDRVLDWSDGQKFDKFEKIKCWFGERKSWSKQARRLLDWLKDDVIG